MKFAILGFLHVLFLASFSFAGHMSGGGGGDSSKPRQITTKEIEKILETARREVYMTLALESQNTSFPWPELFNGRPTIFQLLKEYRIYGGDYKCQDTFGKSKDGSIQSPVPNSICISPRRLSNKLNVDNARARVLSLVAHEFSHLKDFDEAQAQALEKWLLPKFANSSSDQSTQLLDYMTRKSFDIRGSLAAYQKIPKSDLNWDSLCFISERIMDSLKIIEQLATDKPFSILDRQLYREQNSFLIKQIVITTQVCAQSHYHPEKMYMQENVGSWFKEKETLVDLDLKGLLLSSEFDVLNNILLLENLPIRRIHTFQDFEIEMSEVAKYIFDMLTVRIAALWALEEPVIRSTPSLPSKIIF